MKYKLIISIATLLGAVYADGSNGGPYCDGCTVTSFGENQTLMGFENDKPCEIDIYKCTDGVSGKKIENNDKSELVSIGPYGSVYCEGCTVTSFGENKSLWGFEDNTPCEIDVYKCTDGVSGTKPTVFIAKSLLPNQPQSTPLNTTPYNQTSSLTQDLSQIQNQINGQSGNPAQNQNINQNQSTVQNIAQNPNQSTNQSVNTEVIIGGSTANQTPNTSNASITQNQTANTSSGSTSSSKRKGVGKTTRYWDCCKPSCAWPGKASVTAPVRSCNKSNSILSDYNIKSGCEGGEAYSCADYHPWMMTNDKAYGFAAANVAGSSESSLCCTCFKLTFTSTTLANSGKTMIVQIINTGSDLGQNQFDLQIPGGGLGLYDGCSSQFGVDASSWGDRYGGISSLSDCSKLPTSLQDGCKWRFGFFENANNPTVEFEETECPHELTVKSGCQHL